MRCSSAKSCPPSTHETHVGSTGMGCEDARQPGANDAAFSAHRVVRPVHGRIYVAPAHALQGTGANSGALGAQLVGWSRDLARGWPDARFGAVRVVTDGTTHHILVEVDLGRLDPEAVCVELFAETTNGAEPERHVMARGSKVAGSGTRYEYGVSVPAARATGDYTPRLLPYHPSAAVPLEAHEVLWQR